MRDNGGIAAIDETYLRATFIALVAVSHLGGCGELFFTFSGHILTLDLSYILSVINIMSKHYETRSSHSAVSTVSAWQQ
jgi:hypothetical protein